VQPVSDMSLSRPLHCFFVLINNRESHLRYPGFLAYKRGPMTSWISWVKSSWVDSWLFSCFGDTS